MLILTNPQPSSKPEMETAMEMEMEIAETEPVERALPLVPLAPLARSPPPTPSVPHRALLPNPEALQPNPPELLLPTRLAPPSLPLPSPLSLLRCKGRENIGKLYNGIGIFSLIEDGKKELTTE